MTSPPFLKEIATALLQPGQYNLAETCVVFPNKRARLYLSKYIGELTDKPVWAPRYASINELMEGLSGFIIADRLTLMFELFEEYKLATGSPESFDNFYSYADPLLADFDELDKYLVNAGDLFSNLAGLKSLEGRFNYLSDEQVNAIRLFWNTFDPENSSDGQKTFMSLWNVLPEMYSGLRNRLAGQGLAYEGMAYRKVADDLNGPEPFEGFNSQKYIFIGFNALNTCEEKLFRYLKNIGKAEFFWDYDNWYKNNEDHEAGFFIRRNIMNFPQTKSIPVENLASGEKQIYFLPVPSNTGQAEALPYVFEKLGIGKTGENEHIALVLADENLLFPALYSIPQTVSGLNITMGYPMAGSAVFNLVDSLYELSKNKRRISDGTVGYYYKDVLSILGNPLLKPIYDNLLIRIRKLAVEKNLVYISADGISDGPDADIIFRAEEHRNPCHYLLQVTEHLLRSLAGSENLPRTDPIQLEILYQVYSFLTRLKDLLTGYAFFPDEQTLFRLIRRMLRTLHIPFSGEPLSGLQVLGVLETRTLDFDHVIILSMNEGVLPRVTSIPSFIPQNLRYGFGLPTPEHQDAIYAYYFFRLLQRAANVVLIYDSSTGGLRTGERSRFMHQLYYEFPFPVVEINPSFKISLLPVLPIVVEKTGAVAEKLMRYTGEEAKLMSPSAINEFLNCPLRFYFHHIAGLPQPEEVTEEIDALMFGNLLHRSMQILYGRFGSSVITPELMEELLDRDEILENGIDKAFREVLFGERNETPDRRIEGFNLIVRQIIKSYIRNLIRADQESCPFSIADLEQKISTNITLSVEGRSLSVKIGGTIDRIDRFEKYFRIIDYKTGTVKKSFNTIESLFNVEEKGRNDAVFQVLTYSMVYHRLNPVAAIVPALCFVRGSHAGNFSYQILYGEKKKVLESYSEVEEEFESNLALHLSGLFNINEPFVQTTNRQVCQNCPYIAVCRRENNV